MTDTDEQILSQQVVDLGNVFTPEYWPSPRFPVMQTPLPSLGTDPTNDDLLWYSTLLAVQFDEVSDEQYVNDAILESGGRFTARNIPGFRICRSYIKKQRLTYGMIYVKGESQVGLAIYKAAYKMVSQNMMRQKRGFYVSRDLETYCAENDAEPFPAHAAESFKVH